MRKERKLAENVWYLINTAVNNGEPLFLSEFGVWLLEWVLSEARELYAFELRGVRFAGASVSFFIKPADGFELPEIMKWIKQTFALRFNWDDGRTGHIWGAQGRTRSVLFVTPAARRAPDPGSTNDPPNGADRYQSEILPGEPPEWAEAYVFMAIDRPVQRGDWKREAATRGLGKKAGNAGAANRTPGAEGRPRSRPDAEKARVQADLPRRTDSRPA
jgi:hypothetical protein